MTFGSKIKRLRESRKLSQMELSIILGISQTKLFNIEKNDDKDVGIMLIKKLCDYFKVDFDYFLNEKQIIKVENKNDSVLNNSFSTLSNFPESLVDQLKLLIAENKDKKLKINSLEGELNKYKKKD